jgi:hypothetical protein
MKQSLLNRFLSFSDGDAYFQRAFKYDASRQIYPTSDSSNSFATGFILIYTIHHEIFNRFSLLSSGSGRCFADTNSSETSGCLWPMGHNCNRRLHCLPGGYS